MRRIVRSFHKVMISNAFGLYRRRIVAGQPKTPGVLTISESGVWGAGKRPGAFRKQG